MKACNESLKDLAIIHDEESMDTFVSLYFDGRDEHFIRNREKAVESVLNREELETFMKTMEKIKTYLEGHKPSDIAVFASDKHDYFEVVSFPAEVENALVVDTAPYIRPLAEFADEWQAYTLVLLNSNHAKIFTFSCGEITEEEELSAHIKNRHKKGGMSQARFQRLRKGSIHAFLKDVVEELTRTAEKDIILAGPGEAKKTFYEMLPKNLQEGVLSVVDVDMGGEREIFEESHEIMAEREKEERIELLEVIKKDILTNGLAVYGIPATLNAAKNGQVEVLLVEKDYKQRGWKCEHCQSAGDGILASCPVCGKETAEADIVEELVRFAEETDSLVEFTSNEDIKRIGHVAGLLRYK